MTAVVWVCASLAAALHILVFVWESLVFRRPGVHRRIFSTPTEEVDAVRLWSFCVGFYNLFLAAGMITGVVLWAAGEEAVGRALVVYVCLFMVLSAIVLFVADRRAMSRPRGRGIGGVIGQGGLPLVALLAAAV